MFGSSVLNYMISARTAQGYEDFQNSTAQERREIILRWKENKSELQSPKQTIYELGGPEGQESGRLSPKGFMQTRHLSFEERKRLSEERKAKREAERNKVQSKDGRRSCPFCRRDKPHTHAPRPLQDTPYVNVLAEEETNLEFEQAIHDSVAATSRGNPEEDAMIERAIRASVRELQRSQGSQLTSQEALDRAIQASIAEANRGRSAREEHPSQISDEDAEHQALLEKAIQESLALHQSKSEAVDGVPGDDEEELKLAIQKSKEELSRAKTEEEIVLEYVKKQSLAEEEHRKAREAAVKVKPEKSECNDSAADEEALRLAIEASLKGASGSGA